MQDFALWLQQAFWLPPLLILIIVPTFGLVVGKRSGWQALARRYPGNASHEGQRFSMISGAFGGFGNYNNCLTLDVGARGFRISIWAPMRLGHPPIFVPWSAVQALGEEKRWFKMATRLSLHGVERPVFFYGPAAAKLRAEYHRHQGPHSF